jgi:hypothetical protein
VLNRVSGPLVVVLILAALAVPAEREYGQGTAPNEILQEVDFVADRGNTWSAACITMLVSRYRKGVTLDEVVRRTGYPPVLNYRAADDWLRRAFKLRLTMRGNGTVGEIAGLVERDGPVMVLQQIPGSTSCSHSLVVGHNRDTREFIFRDPSNQGIPFRKTYAQFLSQWDITGAACAGWPAHPYLTIDPAGYPGDEMLEVPFEENRGSTCASSSMTMLIRYFRPGAGFREVLARAGMPPIINYDAVARWMKKAHGLEMIRYDGKTVQDIMHCIRSGYPVMVIQQFRADRAEGHNRVVVGFNTARDELMLNDPSELGAEYRMPVPEFERLWDLLPGSCPGWPPRPMWLVVPAGKAPPLAR